MRWRAAMKRARFSPTPDQYGSGQHQLTDGSGAQYPITIYSGNAFLTAARAVLFPTAPASCLPGASFTATASATACPSFQMNRMDNDLMSRLSLDQHTGALAVGAGLEGVMRSAASPGTSPIPMARRAPSTPPATMSNTARFYAALDAVRDPATGNIVCNVSLTAPGAFPGLRAAEPVRPERHGSERFERFAGGVGLYRRHDRLGRRITVWMISAPISPARHSRTGQVR